MIFHRVKFHRSWCRLAIASSERLLRTSISMNKSLYSYNKTEFDDRLVSMNSVLSGCDVSQFSKYYWQNLRKIKFRIFATTSFSAQWHKLMSAISLQNFESKIGPNTDPWGTPNLWGIDLYRAKRRTLTNRNLKRRQICNTFFIAVSQVYTCNYAFSLITCDYMQGDHE